MNTLLARLAAITCFLSTACGQPENVPEPAAYGALPEERQIKWQELESYVLIHFTPTTFENKEWGYGDADPAIFNPTAFDAAQIVGAAKAGGFKGVILVAKHHDGFTLWPSKTTEYNISKSGWKNGKGNMVKEFETATRNAGLSFGVYCSPWDRNFPTYGTAAYVAAFREQLRELYTGYGDLFITWFDGANGGDGYYGGAREKRNIDRTTYYGWDTTLQLVRDLQPGAVMFSDMGDVRWVGNEEGHAAPTSWATFTPEPVDGKTIPAPGEIKYWLSPEGTRNGKYWKPAECDVPLRPGWFYHADQDHRVKTPAQLLDLYYKSVGRGAALDLGLSPDTRGLLHANDVESLTKFGELKKAIFSTNVAKSATLNVSTTRGNAEKQFGAQHLIDEDRYSYWATDDSVHTGDITLTWSDPQTFSVIQIRENIKLGQRIEQIAVDIKDGDTWKEIAQATSIGANRLIPLGRSVQSSGLRIRILKSPVALAVSDIGVFLEPKEIPTVSYINKPTPGALNKKDWKIVNASAASVLPEGAATNAIDGDPSTIWHTWNSEKDMNAPPQSLTVDMGKEQMVKAFTYLPRTGGSWGVVTRFEWQISSDGKTWTTVATGEFANIKANPIEQVVNLPKPATCRYFKFIGKSAVEDNYISAAELGAL